MFEILFKYSDVRFGKKEKFLLIIGLVRLYKFRFSDFKY